MNDSSKTREQLLNEIAELRSEVSLLSSGSFWADSSRGLGAQNWTKTVERFRELMSAMQAVFLEIDADGCIAGSSNVHGGFLGQDTEALEGVELAALIHEEDQSMLSSLLTPESHTTQHSFRFIHKDGQWRYFELEVASSPDESGRRLVFCRDVTAVQHAVMALRESEDRYRALTENAKDLITELDEAGRFRYVSPTSVEILGFAPGDLEGKSFEHLVRSDTIHPEDADELISGFNQTVTVDQRGGDGTYRIRHPEGGWRWMESRAQTYRNRDGGLRAVVISRDVTERIEAQRELQELEKRYLLLGAASRDMITESDPDGKLIFVSQSARDLLGYEPEELIGTLGRELLHPEDKQRIEDEFWLRDAESDVVFSPPYRCRTKEGKYRWFESAAKTYTRTDGSGPYIIGLLRDVTERLALRKQQRELEEHVQRSQRLEGLGVMAGGIAHDFNNLLTPILGQASLALMDLDDGSDPRTRIEKIRNAARRAAKLTNQMLAYAGAEPMVFEPTDVSSLVSEMGQLLESAVSGKAIIRFELTEGLPAIDADSAQISQVVMNLISNAVEAVEGGNDSIHVRTHSLTSRELYPQDLVVGTVAPGTNYVCFEVEDTGAGMSGETRSKIFDPFFTTKFTGRGLGLAAVLGIIRGHDGAIELRSRLGRGTRFRVWLPPREAPAERPTPEAIEEWQSSGLVLVADDDRGVLEIAVDTLQRCGMVAVTALDGSIAVDLFRERRADVRAVMLDRTMPGLSGEAAFTQIREMRSDVPIIMVSGYSEESVSDRVHESGVDAFLRKPFLPEAMIATLRKVLDD